jgi:hypothetical protein
MTPTRAIFLLFLPVSLLHAAIAPPNAALTEREQQMIATANLDAHSAPRFNGAMIVGGHPHTPLI